MSTLPYPTPVQAPDLENWMLYYGQALLSLDPVPAKLIVQPGLEVAWDSCKDPDCGMGWVRIVEITPLVAPRQRVLANGARCGVTGWDVKLGVGVIRCIATLDAKGRPPSATRISDDGGQFARDMAVLIQVLTCDDNTKAFVNALPLGPEGGCAGSEVIISVEIACVDCSPELIITPQRS
jgi:hypothetical protein